MSIKVSNISKVYGNQEVLSEVSFSISPGEIVGFLGPNGAGKSTCIKIITGWITPDSGSIFINGYNISENPIGAKSILGYLPENNPLYTEMYVKEYLMYVAGLYKVQESSLKIKQLSEQLKLIDVLHKKISTLSKGYRQRVGLAQALIHNPPIIILDEPFSGLDPNQLNEVHSFIKELGKEKAILFSSHSLQEVSELSDRTIIINKGRIVADFSLSELPSGKSLETVFKELTL